MHRSLADFGSGSFQMYDILAFSKALTVADALQVLVHRRTSEETVLQSRMLGRLSISIRLDQVGVSMQIPCEQSSTSPTSPSEQECLPYHGVTSRVN
jgi:hypothetical protein